jgi:hypothetical protein
MKSKIIFAAWCAGLLAGCANNQEPIVFNDEPQVRSLATNAVVVPPPVIQGLDRADEVKIEQLVFGYLLERHFWDASDYSAVFLQADDAQVKSLMKLYPDHVPPIKPAYRAELPANRAPLDRDTGRAAMILSVDVGEPNADDSVDAIGRWYGGGAVTGFYTFTLAKTGGDWQVQNVK